MVVPDRSSSIHTDLFFTSPILWVSLTPGIRSVTLFRFYPGVSPAQDRARMPQGAVKLQPGFGVETHEDDRIC
jgi:hypothetical protein